MTAGKYILRAVKYLVKLLILFAILFALMMWSETSTLSFDNVDAFFASYFGTVKGWLFTAVVIIWSAVYPKVEFVTRRAGYDMREGRDVIIKVFDLGKMVLADETEDRMVFHGESIGRRLWFLWDDSVTVTRNEAGGFDMEGPRRFVGEAQQRIPGYMELAKVEPLRGDEGMKR